MEALDARGDRCRVQFTYDGLISGDVSPNDSYWRTTLALDDETIVQSTTSDGSKELPPSSGSQPSPSSDSRGRTAEDATGIDLGKTPSTWVEIPSRWYFIFGTDNRMLLLSRGATPDPIVFRTQLPDGRERRILVKKKTTAALNNLSLF